MSVNKYGAKKTEIDGIMFDSKHEAHRWCELKYMERTGLIYDLQRQVSFVVIPRQYDEISGKLIEREAKYIADFTYRDKRTNKLVVEDAKSPATRTAVYLLKKKILRWRYGIEIQEV